MADSIRIKNVGLDIGKGGLAGWSAKMYNRVVRIKAEGPRIGSIKNPSYTAYGVYPDRGVRNRNAFGPKTHENLVFYWRQKKRWVITKTVRHGKQKAQRFVSKSIRQIRNKIRYQINQAVKNLDGPGINKAINDSLKDLKTELESRTPVYDYNATPFPPKPRPTDLPRLKDNYTIVPARKR